MDVRTTTVDGPEDHPDVLAEQTPDPHLRGSGPPRGT